MERALIIKNLVKSYDKEPVLKGLNLDIPKGNIFGLIGPNGAGKSTLIGILTGLLNFDSGEVTINNLTLNTSNEIEIKKDVASVFQPPLLFENFTSLEYICYVCDMYEIEKKGLRKKIDSLFSYFEISSFTHFKTKELSSGSRKKLSFCAAILTEPKLLFLDEPFESVDVISIGRMKTILRKLKEKGTTVVLTSHILEVVENLCDDIAILHGGEIIVYLDAVSRKKLQKDSTLNDIFEKYIEVNPTKDELLDWI